MGAGEARDLAVVPAGPGPELNDIKRTFRTVKHGAMPQRTFTAVDAAFKQVNVQLQPSE